MAIPKSAIQQYQQASLDSKVKELEAELDKYLIECYSPTEPFIFQVTSQPRAVLDLLVEKYKKVGWYVEIQEKYIENDPNGAWILDRIKLS